MYSKRPFGVTLLLWMVLSLSAWGVTRFVAALQAWDVLNEYESSLSPLYLSITGTGWSVAGCALLFGLWRSKSWSRPAAAISVFIWLIEYWLERIFFQSQRANMPFALTCSATLLFFLWAVAILPNIKSFFKKSEEHEQPIKNSNSE